MEQFKSLLEIGVDNWIGFLIKSIMLVGITAFALWAIFFALVKFTQNKTKLHQDIFMRLQFLWALFLLFMLFNVYWFYFIKVNGIHEFTWGILTFYADISVQLLVYLLIVIAFIYGYSKYYSLLKK